MVSYSFLHFSLAITHIARIYFAYYSRWGKVATWQKKKKKIRIDFTAVNSIVLKLFLIRFSKIENSNWTEWSAIWSEIICVVTKSEVWFQTKIARHEVQLPLYYSHFEIAEFSQWSSIQFVQKWKQKGFYIQFCITFKKKLCDIEKKWCDVRARGTVIKVRGLIILFLKRSWAGEGRGRFGVVDFKNGSQLINHFFK